MVYRCFCENYYISMNPKCNFFKVPLRKEKKNTARGTMRQCFFGQSCTRHDISL